MNTQRGHAATGATMVVLALAAVATVGLHARTRDLGFEARSLRRHQARWAAESAVARARARRAAGLAIDVQGNLPKHLVCDRIRYSAVAPARDRVVATGICVRAGRSDVRMAIDVRLQGEGRGRIVDWREAPTVRR